MGRLTKKTTHSDLPFDAIRLPRNRILSRVYGALSCLSALGLLGLPTTATALDGRLASGTTLVIQPAESVDASTYRQDQPATVAVETSWLNRWVKKTLARVPLRPIRIGETPRRPDDPEPGMGVVLRLPF